jgi:hypothetical protein
VYGVRTSGEKDSKGSREYKGGGRLPSLLALAGQRKFAGNAQQGLQGSPTCDVFDGRIGRFRSYDWCTCHPAILTALSRRHSRSFLTRVGSTASLLYEAPLQCRKYLASSLHSNCRHCLLPASFSTLQCASALLTEAASLCPEPLAGYSLPS